jgi:hypothetical protein
MPDNYQMNSKNVENEGHYKKPKNIFRSGPYLPRRKQIIYRTPNIYNSFMNISAPFITYIDSSDKNKNSYLVCFKSGPKMKIQISRNTNETNNKEVIYSNVRKPCGCFYKKYVTKLSKSLSPAEKFKYNNMNNMNIYKQKINLYTKINNRSCNKMSNAINLKKYSGLTNNLLSRQKSEKILSTYNKEGYNRNKRYEYRGIYEEEKNKLIDKFRQSCYNFRPSFDKTFHKTQIFDHCKPYLADHFQEFPD